MQLQNNILKNIFKKSPRTIIYHILIVFPQSGVLKSFYKIRVTMLQVAVLSL